MPEISRFFGIVIRMYCEPTSRHALPHFHAHYQEQAAVYRIGDVELIAGALPRRQMRLVEAWAELHQDELMLDWGRLLRGELPTAIEPLR